MHCPLLKPPTQMCPKGKVLFLSLSLWGSLIVKGFKDTAVFVYIYRCMLAVLCVMCVLLIVSFPIRCRYYNFKWLYCGWKTCTSLLFVEKHQGSAFSKVE